jgi:hypothetical protein
MTGKLEIPKKKPNYFSIYSKNEKKFVEIKYLTQQEIADGWIQNIHSKNKKLINHFSVTLAFLPDNLWKYLKKVIKNDEEYYKTIKNGLTKYNIIETNQDDIMIKLYNEIHKDSPNKILIEEFINELDSSQYSSWLVMRSRHYLQHNVLYFPNEINDIEDIDVTRFL